ncbi:MAG: lipid II:glycine glycyltransferase FemX [Patescibacteria group bacterium]
MTDNSRIFSELLSQPLRQSGEYAEYMRGKGWLVEEVRCKNFAVRCFIKKLPWVGSVIKIQHPVAIPEEKSLDKLARKYHALFVKIEPFFGIEKRPSYLQEDTWPLLPTKTLYLDLETDLAKIKESLDSDAQYSIRKAKSLLCVNRYPADNFEQLRLFCKILRRTGGRKKFYTPDWEDLKTKAKSFGKKASLLLARKKKPRKKGNGLEHPVAGCLLFTHKKTAFYHHAATSEEGRDLLAGYLVLWEAIKLAKERDKRFFDFEGIYDSRYHKQTKDWRGFTYFKKKFGGKEVVFPKPLVKYYSLPLKLMFKIFG